MKNKDLFITGYGTATCLGISKEVYAKELDLGNTHFRQHPLLQNTEEWKPSVSYLDDAQLLSGINPRIQRKLDRFSLLTLQAFQETKKQAQFHENDMASFGLLLGNCTGGWSFVESQLEDIYRGNYDSLNPYVATAWFPTAPQGEISIQDKISGYSKTFSADALSAGYALEHAMYLIEHNYMPGAFVGGVEAPLSPLVYNSCMRYEPLSPSGNYRPYHKNSDGYLLGEGAGLISIEHGEHMHARKGNPLARLTGLGLGSTLADAIHKCLQDAQKKPLDIQCIFLDAKGTSKLDREEYAALESIFKGSQDLFLTTTKTLHGNLLGADFGVQLSLATHAIFSQKIPRGLYSKTEHLQPPVGQLILDDAKEIDLRNVLLYCRNLNGASIAVLLEQA